MVSAFFMFYQSIPIRACLDTVCCWWASPSDTLMSLLIRYTHIPFYFRFSFTSSTSSIHHYAHPHQRDHTMITLASSDWSRLFDGHMFYNSHVFTSILSIPNVCPPVIWPIMSPHTMWSGTFYSFALDEPYALFLVDHSYLTCMYLPFTPGEPQPVAYTSFPQNSNLALMPCIAPHSPHTISHCIALPCNPTVFTLHHTPRSHSQSPIEFILRSLAP